MSGTIIFNYLSETVFQTISDMQSANTRNFSSGELLLVLEAAGGVYMYDETSKIPDSIKDIYPTDGRGLFISKSITVMYVDENNNVFILNSSGAAEPGEDPARNLKNPCVAATLTNFPSVYNNGASGVGATLTATSTGVYIPDGVTLTLNNRVAFKNQTITPQNGIYTCTVVGAVGVAAVFTRSTDMDKAIEFDYATTLILGGTQINQGWTQSSIVVTVGTDPVTFVQTSSGTSGTVTSITAGTGLSGGTITTSGTLSLLGPVSSILGGTGVSNNFNISLGGALSTTDSFSQAGAFPTTLTSTGPTNATLPAGTTTLVPTTGTGAIGTWTIAITGNSSTVTTNANLTGPITSIGNATSVTANSITYASIQQGAPSILLGNPIGSGANIQGITLGTNLSFSGNVLNAASGGGGTVTSITAGTGLTGGTITGFGTISLSSPVASTLGGTGTINNFSISVGGALSTAAAFTQSGSFATTLISTAITNATLPAGTTTLVPTTGTGATGTWSINVTGNAATVTTNANLTGPITSTGNATSITPNSITYAAIQQGAAGILLGNPTGSSANLQGITLGTNLSFSGSVLNATGGGGGGVTSITAGTGLAGGTITTSGTISLSSPVASTLGGTGTANSFNIIVGGQLSTAAAFTQAGAFSTTITSTATTNATLPAGTTTLVPTTGTGATGTWGISISGNSATTTTNANLTGVVTSAGNATSIANNAIGFLKLQQAFGFSLVGNPSGSTGNVFDVPIGAGLAFISGVLNTTGGIISSSTANKIAYYASNGTTVSGTSFIFDDGSNLFLGTGSGTISVSGSDNHVYSIGGLSSLTTGDLNNAFGGQAGKLINSGVANNLFGYSAGANLKTGNGNIIIGHVAGINYTTSESSNIILFSPGVVGESGRIRIGTNAQTDTYISGINGVNVGSVSKVVTINADSSGDKLGSSIITAGTGITVTPGANTITIAATASGSGTVSSGLINQLAYYAAAGTTVSGLTTIANASLLTNGSSVPGWVAYTGTGSPVLATSPTLVTPLLGTPTSGILTNCTGLPISTGVSGLGAGIATFLATPTSANLAAAVTGETGTGALVFSTSPVLVTPALGVPTSGDLSSCTSLPLTSGVTGILPLANGGTNSSLTASAGGLIYSTATGFAISTPAGGANRLFLSGTSGTGAPTATTYTVPNSISGTTGKFWRSNGTNMLFSTVVYADAYNVNDIVYASSANSLSGLASASSAILLTDATGVPTYSSSLTNGQVTIGSTGSIPVTSTLTPGSGINIINGAGSITISATGNPPYVNNTASATVTMAPNTVYGNNRAGSTIYNLPSSLTIGDTYEIVGVSGTTWHMAVSGAVTLRLASQASVLEITSQNTGSCVKAIATSSTTLTVYSYVDVNIIF